MSTVIKAEHLSKEYRLGAINHGMLYKDIQSWIARKTGREDPHAQIGVDHFADHNDRFWALKDLNFEIHQGDRVGIIGRNGAGKSTLLKILSRITAPTEGVARIKGRVASLLEVGTGFHGELTGRENIYLNGAILGMKRRETARKLDEIIEFSEIEQYIDTPVKRYSSGMYVRLAFAVAAHLDSEILVADEVLAVGDAEFQKKAIGKMGDLSSGQGRTVLFVSHNMSAIRQLCVRGIVLEKGRMTDHVGIEEAIARYMRSSALVSTTWSSRGDNDRRGDIQVLEMFLTDGNRQKIVRAVEAFDHVELHLLFELFSKNKNLTIGISLYNSSGENIYRSLTSDTGESVNAKFELGVNHVTCRLPLEFLRAGVYDIVVDCSIHQEKWLICPDTDKEFSIRLEVENHGFGNRHLPMGKVAPRIIWEVVASSPRSL